MRVPSRRRPGPALALAALALAALAPAAASGRSDGPTQAAEQRLVRGAESEVAVSLPTRLGAPAPTVARFRAPLPRHEVVGFVPGGVAGELGGADLADTSELCYFGLDLGASGAIVRSGSAWSDLAAPSFADFVSAAHRAGDGVLLALSVPSSEPRVLARLLARPAASAARLASGLVPLLAADRLDGVDLDVEGRAASERGGFTAFVAALASKVHAASPSATLMVNTYVDSAEHPAGFFDVAALARVATRLFVMGYDLASASAASPNAPLDAPPGGLSIVAGLAAYVRAAPPGKVVLGVPFYGYDFPVASGAARARAVSSPYAVTYASIVAAGHRGRWDPVSLTPWYAFDRAGHWHETWYDDPVSIALKTALASELHLAGVGAWSLGQEGGATAMLAALDGGSAPLKTGG